MDAISLLKIVAMVGAGWATWAFLESVAISPPIPLTLAPQLASAKGPHVSSHAFIHAGAQLAVQMEDLAASMHSLVYLECHGLNAG